LGVLGVFGGGAGGRDDDDVGGSRGFGLEYKLLNEGSGFVGEVTGSDGGDGGGGSLTLRFVGALTGGAGGGGNLTLGFCSPLLKEGSFLVRRSGCGGCGGCGGLTFDIALVSLYGALWVAMCAGGGGGGGGGGIKAVVLDPSFVRPLRLSSVCGRGGGGR
jgi:hypothetical protein